MLESELEAKLRNCMSELIMMTIDLLIIILRSFVPASACKQFFHHVNHVVVVVVVAFMNSALLPHVLENNDKFSYTAVQTRLILLLAHFLALPASWNLEIRVDTDRLPINYRLDIAANEVANWMPSDTRNSAIDRTILELVGIALRERSAHGSHIITTSMR
jgi:hypothetical protein